MAKVPQKNNGLVYSSEHGRMCPSCLKPANQCECKKKKPLPPRDGIVRIGHETKGRRGKGVTVVTGVPLDEAGLIILVQQLKKKCGSGGTIKNGVIELQGDHRELVIAELAKHSWTIKRIGG